YARAPRLGRLDVADQNSQPHTVASITREGRAPQTHAYDDPDLSPIEFLQAVYRDPLLPMSLRIDAARGLLPYTEPRPASTPSSHIGCTIVIGGLGPCAADPSPEQINSETQSFPLSASNSRQPSSRGQGSSNTETPSNPPKPKPFLSTPGPSFIEYTEILEIKAAVNKLRPDLAHLPIPDHFYHCSCWDCWFTLPCDCPRDGSKLN